MGRCYPPSGKGHGLSPLARVPAAHERETGMLLPTLWRKALAQNPSQIICRARGAGVLLLTLWQGLGNTAPQPEGL